MGSRGLDQLRPAHGPVPPLRTPRGMGGWRAAVAGTLTPWKLESSAHRRQGPHRQDGAFPGSTPPTPPRGWQGAPKGPSPPPQYPSIPQTCCAFHAQGFFLCRRRPAHLTHPATSEERAALGPPSHSCQLSGTHLPWHPAPGPQEASGPLRPPTSPGHTPCMKVLEAGPPGAASPPWRPKANTPPPNLSFLPPHTAGQQPERAASGEEGVGGRRGPTSGEGYTGQLPLPSIPAEASRSGDRVGGEEVPNIET